MPDELKPEAAADFAVDYREGERMAREWIAGRGELPGLLHIVRDMPRSGDMRGLEADFLSHIDAVVRGDRRSEGSAMDPAKAQLLLEGATAPEAPLIDVDEFRRQRREREVATRLKDLGRRNAALWQDQSAFIRGDHRPKDADWRGS